MTNLELVNANLLFLNEGAWKMPIPKIVEDTLNIHPETKKQMKNIYEKYMFFIGIAGQLLFYFQAYQIFSTHSACSVSQTGFIIAFFSLLSWFFYGLMIKNKVLIFSNGVALVGCALVLSGILIYK
jgi:MtN3 and saliva related transmembrane protein